MSISKLYQTFQKYPLKAPLNKCPCGCIPDEREHKIYSAPLQILGIEDLGFYNHKAMTTWGEVNDYKHFLPRLFELYREDKFNGGIDLGTIHHKLDYANWMEWERSEREAIIGFVKEDWDELVNKEINEFDLVDFEDYLNFLEFEELIEAWNFPANKVALRNFVELFYLNGIDILYNEKKIKIGGKNYQAAFIQLVDKEGLIKGLEEEFFKFESDDKEYGFKISAVLQMIEQNRKNRIH